MGALEGKVIAISGGSRGMGATEAKMAIGEGATVVIGDVLDDLGTELAAEIGATYHHLDVTSPDEWQSFVDAIVDAHGRLDGLVNNAGIFRLGGVLDSDLDTFREVTEVNQYGVFNGMRAVAPMMAAAGSGSIVNISSVAGLRGAGPSAYCASKWAVRGMTKTAARELAASGVRVNSVHPGLIETEMLTQLQVPPGGTLESLVPMGRTANPEEVARAVMFLLSDQSSYMTGAEIAVDGAFSV